MAFILAIEIDNNSGILINSSRRMIVEGFQFNGSMYLQSAFGPGADLSSDNSAGLVGGPFLTLYCVVSTIRH